MAEKLIPATQLAEYVYCSQAWHLKLNGAQVSTENLKHPGTGKRMA
jgi:hypothetical protein